MAIITLRRDVPYPTGIFVSGNGERGATYRESLARKTVSVVGLAKSGVAAARLIRQLGSRVLASDSSPLEALPEEARGLERLGCALWAGGHPDAAFAGADLIVVSPGVPLELPALAAMRARGVPIIGELELAWRVMEADVIAITGTNGKTTTTTLIGELLRTQVRPVLVGGNIGTPLAEHALEFPGDGLVVAEASSFQLDTTDRFRPRVGAILNITPDHLDRHGTFGRYVEAKARMFANQTPTDCAVLNADDPVTAALGSRTRGRVIWFSRLTTLTHTHGVFIYDGWIVAKLNGSTERICPVGEITLRGQHNVENVLAATACALWTGMSPSAIRRGIAGFRGVAHRIERVHDDRGVVYYNDSKGTNVDSTIKALESFSEPIILIAGGKGKGQDFGPLAEAARGRVRRAILIGQDRVRIRAALEPAGIPAEDAESMDDAVRRAREAARVGDVVLLSPACASFDMFRNFEHRGDVFKSVVRALLG
jgi:UDP-N-acetylmuramoylalanine--D-glutamate ligase